MAVFSSVQQAAKTVGKKTLSAAKTARKATQDLLTIRRLRKQVEKEYNRIEETKETIATYIWSKYASGQPLDGQETAYCAEIQRAKQSISQMLAQIDVIQNQKTPQMLPAPGEDWLCADCGALNPSSARFCGGCGKCTIE